MGVDTEDRAPTGSPDSSFYGQYWQLSGDKAATCSQVPGDANTVSALEQRVRAFDTGDWVAQQRVKPGWPQQQPKLSDLASRLHNPYTGVHYAWQLTETLDEFFARLPAATTDQTSELPWIFICNPFVPRVSKNESAARISKGNEDEGPEQEGAKLPILIDGGMERLELLSTFTKQITTFGKSPSVVEKEINQERTQASQDILQLAHAAKVRAGKVRYSLGAADTGI